ncbi:reticulon-like protein B17 [Rutidosis leptorrhynchoides]|uniref:reticulon-like protein B17 n=1 Tax=Rutidosis leptorrhynchoides TaxID=125765 RepID=UPI003A995113
MDCTTPPSLRSNPNNHSQTKSASRLSRIINYTDDPSSPIPRLSMDLIASPSPKRAQFTPSPRSIRSSQELLLLSPSPRPKSRPRLTDRLEMAAAAEEGGVMEQIGCKRRGKSRAAQMSLLGNCGGSPRNNRRQRRRVDYNEAREERELNLAEEIGKLRRRRHNNGKSKKEKLSLVPAVAPPATLSPKVDDDVGEDHLERIGQMISDMVMWRDVAKSSLWFGFGCICFLSSCFAGGINFSIFSAISQLGLLCLAASFFSNSVCQRNNADTRSLFKLKEDDILRVGRLILPATNLAISKTRELFSGEPSMTLKVIPFLLLGAEYGHLITMWRLFALGFFFSFTIPKLYSSHSSQINQKAENLKRCLLDAWGARSHKKLVATSAITAFWNLSSVKTRIFTVFIALVILRYCRQNVMAKAGETEGEESETQEEEKREETQQEHQQQAMVVVASDPPP